MDDGLFQLGKVFYSTADATVVEHFHMEDVQILLTCDAALITLPRAIVFSRYALPIKLPGPEDIPERWEWAMTSGWGAYCDRQVDPHCSQTKEYQLSLENLR